MAEVPIMVRTTRRERFMVRSPADLERQFPSAGGSEASESRPLHGIVRSSVRTPRYVRAARGYFSNVTSVMPFTRLLASSQLPSRVTEVLRTMLPPPGIAQLWNFSL